MIETKRPSESYRRAERQLMSYQREERTPRLFHFAQFLMTMNRTEACYAKVGTSQRMAPGSSPHQVPRAYRTLS
ncbi:type I restriction endonuclease [Stappia stellulata]|uniref:type I restriction endonuclease n=1 Tax=Stappia stellulata TaxID=71235 RepID=UPI001AD90686|nr:type I restriction endonuclease [Stappia stellulata]